MSARLPASMIERLANIERHLDALTDPSDESCCIKPDAKNAVRPYVQSWIEPDVKALLAWARGDKTSYEAENWFPNSKAPPKKVKGE